LSATITVRFSPEEASAIRELAKELDVPYSEIVRKAVRKFVHSRLVVREEARGEPDDWHDYSFSTGYTRTGTPALAGR
jgi:predicted transcriptional regulator